MSSLRKVWGNAPKRATRSRKRRGAAAVEFAVVAPVLFLMIFGLIEFGRMIMVQQALTNAAREGCRTATLVTTTTPNEAEEAARTYLQGVVGAPATTPDVTVSISPNSFTDIEPGDPITVSVAVDMKDVAMSGGLIPFASGRSLVGTATLKRE